MEITKFKTSISEYKLTHNGTYDDKTGEFSEYYSLYLYCDNNRQMIYMTNLYIGEDFDDFIPFLNDLVSDPHTVEVSISKSSVMPKKMGLAIIDHILVNSFYIEGEDDSYDADRD